MQHSIRNKHTSVSAFPGDSQNSGHSKLCASKTHRISCLKLKNPCRKLHFLGITPGTTASVFVVLFTLITSCGDEMHYTLSNDDTAKTHPAIYGIGDSISTGVFADTSFGDKGDLLKVAAQALDGSMEEVFKRLSKGSFDSIDISESAAKKMMRPNLTAFSTEKDWGLRSKLETLTKVTPWHENTSNFGLRSSSITEQVAELQKRHSEAGRTLDPSHIVIMIGANDFCGRRSVEDVRASFTEGLTQINNTFPESKLLISLLPPIAKMKTIEGTDDHVIAQIPETGMRKVESTIKVGGFRKKISVDVPYAEITDFRCHETRKSFCDAMYDDNAEAVNAQYNEMISSLSQGASSKRIIVAKNADIPIDRESLGADCFHPSELTQTRLAKNFVEKL